MFSRPFLEVEWGWLTGILEKYLQQLYSTAENRALYEDLT